MFTIAVFPNVTKANIRAILERVLAFFADKKDVCVLLPSKEAALLGHEEFGARNISQRSIDMALSIGGDGTLLNVCRRVYDQCVPVCGINFGTVGFLIDIELDEIETKLQKILDKEYRIEERLMLSGYVVHRGRKSYKGSAVNDIVVTKGGMARMLRFGLSINDTCIANYKADGLIVSTATGSTAYSLSAGGPIVNPLVKALVLTPICPHTFDIRSMVISEDDTIRMSIEAGHPDIFITFDGQKSHQIADEDEVIVQKAKNPARIVKFGDKDYYRTMKEKLWGHP